MTDHDYARHSNGPCSLDKSVQPSLAASIKSNFWPQQELFVYQCGFVETLNKCLCWSLLALFIVHKNVLTYSGSLSINTLKL